MCRAACQYEQYSTVLLFCANSVDWAGVNAPAARPRLRGTVRRGGGRRGRRRWATWTPAPPHTSYASTPPPVGRRQSRHLAGSHLGWARARGRATGAARRVGHAPRWWPLAGGLRDGRGRERDVVHGYRLVTREHRRPRTMSLQYSQRKSAGWSFTLSGTESGQREGHKTWGEGEWATLPLLGFHSWRHRTPTVSAGGPLADVPPGPVGQALHPPSVVGIA